MNRTAKLLCGCCLLFLLVQWLLSQHFSSDGDSEKETSEKTSPKRVQSTRVYGNIANFSSICHKHGVPVLFIDPPILGVITNGNNGTVSYNPHCKFLCREQLVTYFGVEKHLWKDQVKAALLDELTGQGFSAWLFHQSSPPGLSFKDQTLNAANTILTHVLLERDGHQLLLVVLYERGQKQMVDGAVQGEVYLWYGRLQGIGQPVGKYWDIRKQANIKDLPLGKHEAVWKRFEVSKVTIDGVHLRAPTYPAAFLNMLPHSRFIECNHQRAAKFHSLHPQDLSTKASMFRDKAWILLSKAKETLDQLGIPFWLSSGTCLGWFRQCDLIPYSEDVDIGIWIKDFKKSLIPAMQMSGLALKHLFGKVSDSYELSFQADGIKLDIFFFYEEDTYMWNGGTQFRTGNKYKYIFPKFTLCWTEFMGLLFQVPCDTESYVKANYGSDWFEPVKKWDWKRSPPNVQENGQWPKEEWPDVLVTYQ